MQFYVEVWYNYNAHIVRKYTSTASDPYCIHSAVAHYDHMCMVESKTFVQLWCHNPAVKGTCTLLASNGEPIG